MEQKSQIESTYDIHPRIACKDRRKTELETLSADEAVGCLEKEFKKFFVSQPPNDDGWNPKTANIKKAYEQRVLIASKNKKKLKVENKFVNEIFHSTPLPLELATEACSFLGCGRMIEGKPCGGPMDWNVEFERIPDKYFDSPQTDVVAHDSGKTILTTEWICNFHFLHESKNNHLENRFNLNHCDVCSADTTITNITQYLINDTPITTGVSDYSTGLCWKCVAYFDSGNSSEEALSCCTHKFKCNLCLKSVCDGHCDSCPGCPYSIIAVDDCPKYCNDCSMEVEDFKECLNCVFDIPISLLKNNSLVY